MSIRLLLISLGLLAFSPLARAHDIYEHLTDKRGRSCCSNADCRPAPYRISSMGVEMRVNERWISIPRAAIQYRLLEGDTGETAGGHWCGEPWEGSYITYCAVLPPNVAFGPRRESFANGALRKR
jgi:hypothetical protein